jgi:translation initiation factor IF-3
LTPVRLIDENGVQCGVVSTPDALQRARNAGLDLVEVSPNERPPVCKIMDYGRFKYTQSKHKQKHHEQRLKEVRLRPRTDTHDRDIKVQRARGFLVDGNRVQFTMLFRGRERVHQDLGLEAFREIIQHLADIAKPERDPRMEGRRMTMILIPAQQATKKPAKPAQQTPPKPVAAAAEEPVAPPETGGSEE